MTEDNVVKLFKCLSDKSRLQILKSLINEDMYVELLAQRLNLAPSTISFHLKKLEDVGAVASRKEQYYSIYSINEEVFKSSILDIIKEKSSEAELQRQREDNYRKKVIENFFEYGKLKNIPAQRKKRRIILEEIAKAFEPDKMYTEREVNIIIADFHDDFCTLRREMICENILTRDNSIYRLVNGK
ncbi:MAG: metalloregulator ArsR/SmtB family transcription factor [Clostridiales bacterium]|jgi:ArsR family transcriptional regulator|nr:metalloregulator ArsR/SmtB family transcription factor [Clostridiales bacterium]